MLILLVLLLIAGLFTWGESWAHRDGMGWWRGIAYFFPLGMGLVAAAFALVNLGMAFLMPGPDGRPWFLLFATAGGIVAGVLVLIVMGLSILWRGRLRWKMVGVGSAGLFVVLGLLLWMVARIPSLNWS